MANFITFGAAGIGLDSSRTLDLIQNSDAVTNAGRYRVQMWTPDSTVYIGGAGLSPGSSMINSNGTANGFLLLPNTLYETEALFGIDGGLDEQLFGTSTAAASGNTPGALLYVFLQLLLQ